MGEIGTGAPIFNVSPEGPDVSLTEAGLALLGETGPALCLLQAIDSARSIATPVTKYVFRIQQTPGKKGIRPAKNARKSYKNSARSCYHLFRIAREKNARPRCLNP